MGVASMVAMRAASRLDADVTGDTYRAEQGRQVTGDSRALEGAYRQIVAERERTQAAEPSIVESVSGALTRDKGLSL